MIGESFYLLIEMYIAIFSWYAFLRASYTIKQAGFHILLRLQVFFDLYTECSLRLIPYAFLRVDRLEEMLLLMSENMDRCTMLYSCTKLAEQWICSEWSRCMRCGMRAWCVMQKAHPGADGFWRNWWSIGLYWRKTPAWTGRYRVVVQTTLADHAHAPRFFADRGTNCM